MAEQRAPDTAPSSHVLAIDGVATVDDITDRLRQWRLLDGRPSFSEIVRRIEALRAARGEPPESAAPARMTVYDCFQVHRRRLDVALVVDIGCALGLDEQSARQWDQVCWAVQHRVDDARIVTARTDPPAVTPHFVGRIPELDRIANGEDPHAIAIVGMPGAGKTQLAAKSAELMIAARTADQAVFVDLRGHDPTRPPADPVAVTDAILRAIGIDSRRLPADEPNRRAAFCQLLADARVLLILDAAAGADQVRPLVPPRGAFNVLITSRVGLSELDVEQVSIGGLDDDASADLLLAAAGPNQPSGARSVARDLAHEVGNLPLALGVVASRIAANPSWTLSDHLSSLAARHEQLRLDERVRTTLDVSYRALDPAARRALRLLATQPCPDLDLRTFAALLDVPERDAQRIAHLLVHDHMAVSTRDGRIGLHALVRTQATASSIDEDRPSDRDDALARMADRLIDVARRATDAVQNSSREVSPAVGSTDMFDATTGADWLALEHQNLLTLSGHAVSGRPAIALEISRIVGRHLLAGGLYRDALILHERALRAARETGDVGGQGHAELHLGQTQVRLADREAAAFHLERAAVLLADAADVKGAIAARNALAVIAAQSGEFDSALAGFRAVAAAASTHCGLADLAAALDNIAIVLRRQGDLEGALQHHTQAHSVAADAGDVAMTARSLTNLSDVLLLLSRPDDALRTARAALHACRGSQLPSVTAYAVTNVGMALSELGSTTEAMRHHQDALNQALEMGDRFLEASVLNNMGSTCLAAGHLDAATARFTAARDLAEELDHEFERNRAREGSARVEAVRAGQGANETAPR